MPNAVVAPGVRKRSSSRGVSIASTGDKLTYTAPANKDATVTCFWAFHTDALVAFDVKLNDGVGDNTIARSTAGDKIGVLSAGIQMQTGDVFKVNVQTAGAGGATADMGIGYLEGA